MRYLAVGDAEFQKKAIGKMQDIVKGDGRTVLFVSHNMAAVQELCTRILILEHGKSIFEGDTQEGIDKYLNTHVATNGFLDFKLNKKILKAKIEQFKILNASNEVSTIFNSGESIAFKIKIKVNSIIRNPIFSLRVSDANNVSIITWRSNDYVDEPIPKDQNTDFYISINSNNLFLLDSFYSVSMSFLDGKELLDYHDKFIYFEILPNKPNEKFYAITKRKTFNSVIFTEANWKVENIEEPK